MQLGHNRRMTGAQCLADMLKGYGVTHVFHVPAVLRTTYAEMERRTDIKRLHVHGEKAAAYMADGYARASGKPGICMAQVIGALNLAAGLRDAWLAHSPVIAMTGGREPKTKFRQGLSGNRRRAGVRAGDQVQRHVDDVARFPDMVRQAFRVATSGTPGPVHLQFRGNEGQIDAEEAEMEPLVRAAIFPRAGVPSAAGRGERARGAQTSGGVGAPGDRRRRRRARFGRRRANWSRSPRRCKSRSPPRSTARIRSPAIIRSRSASSAPIRARAPTAWSTAPISSASSAPRPAA